MLPVLTTGLHILSVCIQLILIIVILLQIRYLTVSSYSHLLLFSFFQIARKFSSHAFLLQQSIISVSFLCPNLFGIIVGQFRMPTMLLLCTESSRRQARDNRLVNAPDSFICPCLYAQTCNNRRCD